MKEKSLYQQHLLDHYHHPHNQGTLDHPDLSSGVYNPSCGDSIVIQANVANQEITQIKFQGKGCVISQAAASLLTDLVVGKTLSQIQALGVDDMKKLVGIELGPTRLRCALLPLEALQAGIKEFLASGKP